MSKLEYKVSDLITKIKNINEGSSELTNITLIGELQSVNYKTHYYFKIAEGDQTIDAIMYRFNIKKDLKALEGKLIKVNCSISIYDKNCSLKLNVTNVSELGLSGDNMIALTKLKDKLNKKGYFDLARKKAIPLFPNRIAILVGENSQAYNDINSSFKKRWNLAIIDYHYVLVQGNKAVDDICDKLTYVDDLNYDLIILSRGGGSNEELFFLNDEKLADCIFNLKTPIITALGHAGNHFIADDVADRSVITPTEIAQSVFPISQSDLNEKIEMLKEKIIALFNSSWNRFNNLFDLYLMNLNSKIDIDKLYTEIINNEKILERNLSFKLDLIKADLNNFEKDLCNIFNQNLNNTLNKINKNEEVIINYCESLLENFKNKLNALNLRLSDNDINKNFDRGYALVYKNNRLIKEQIINIDDEIVIYYKDKQIRTKVVEVK